MNENEKALLRVALATYQLCVRNRLYSGQFDNPLESAARYAIMQTIGVDVAKIAFDGKADTVLWRKLLNIYNDAANDNRTSLT